MKLSKNEFKRIAKNATKIISENTYTDYSGHTSRNDKQVSYETMIMDLCQCSRWCAYQREGHIDVSGTTCGFTVYL